MNWILCSERMPESQEEVLFYVPPAQYCTSGVYCGHWYKDTDTWSVAYDMYEGDNWAAKYVTHWMPMPEEPK